MEAASADQTPDDHVSCRREVRHRGRARRLPPVPDPGPGPLPGPVPVGDRGPGPVGTMGRPLPGQPGRDQPAQVPAPPQGTHGRADPRTATGPAGAGPDRRPAAQERRRAPAGRPPDRARPGIHRRGPDADPVGHQGRREDLGRRPGHRQAPRPRPRRRPRVLGLGRRGSPPPHRLPDRGTAGNQPPQPDPVPAARHRRDRAAAADRPLQDRPGKTPGRLPGAGGRAVGRHHAGSASPAGPSRSFPSTTATNACGGRHPRSCSSAGTPARSGRSATPHCGTCSTPLLSAPA